MHLLILTPLLLALGCAPAPTTSTTDRSEVAQTPAPDTTRKISGTVISFETRPNIDYRYVVLTYLDDDGMLRSEALLGQEIGADLTSTNAYARRVHLSWVPKEGDRFRMTRDAYANYDITKLEDQ